MNSRSKNIAFIRIAINNRYKKAKKKKRCLKHEYMVKKFVTERKYIKPKKKGCFVKY